MFLYILPLFGDCSIAPTVMFSLAVCLDRTPGEYTVLVGLYYLSKCISASSMLCFFFMVFAIPLMLANPLRLYVKEAMVFQGLIIAQILPISKKTWVYLAIASVALTIPGKRNRDLFMRLQCVNHLISLAIGNGLFAVIVSIIEHAIILRFCSNKTKTTILFKEE